MDDIRVNLQVASALLKRCGYITEHTAADGAEAVRLQMQFSCDVIFMDVSCCTLLDCQILSPFPSCCVAERSNAGDQSHLDFFRRLPCSSLSSQIQMPICDGLEATRRIRAHEAEKLLPRCFVVALTAHASKRDEEECFAAGLDEFLTKPVSVAVRARAALCGSAAAVRLGVKAERRHAVGRLVDRQEKRCGATGASFDHAIPLPPPAPIAGAGDHARHGEIPGPEGCTDSESNGAREEGRRGGRVTPKELSQSCCAQQPPHLAIITTRSCRPSRAPAAAPEGGGGPLSCCRIQPQLAGY